VESPTQVASTWLPQSRYAPACPAFLTADTLAARWLRPHMMDSGPGCIPDDFPVLYGYQG
jgi:hypothetical protein